MDVNEIKEALTDEMKEKLRMIAFNSYDDFSKYFAAKILELYEHNEYLLQENQRYKEALQKIAEYDKETFERDYTEMRKIAAEARK